MRINSLLESVLESVSSSDLISKYLYGVSRDWEWLVEDSVYVVSTSYINLSFVVGSRYNLGNVMHNVESTVGGVLLCLE